MKTEHIVEEVCRLFPAIFQCFSPRTKAQDYRPSLESLSVLQHLLAIGPMTVTEACLHFDRSQASMSEIFARLEARRSVLDFMSTMPAWKDHPDLLATHKKPT